MKNRILILGIISCLILIITSTIIVFLLYSNPSPSEIVFKVQEHQMQKQLVIPKDFKSTATLTAVGDILIHSPLYKTAKTDSGYDFTPMFAEVKPYLEKADITFANQETMIGGSELGLSTYPNFNSPFEVALALQDSGVDIVSIANNHTLDRGEKAIQNALAYYNSIGLQYTGGYSSIEDSNILRTIKRNGITFSFLAYTYGTNGIPVPRDKPYLVNLIELTKIDQEIQQAKGISDVVVVSLHFGNEYQRIPSVEQKEIATSVINFGADIIIGHHPHVLQPMEWIETESGHKGFVAYSLGNFLSGQQSIYREIGGILTLTINKEVRNGETKITVANPEFISTYVSRPYKFKVVPLKNGTEYGLTEATALYQEIDQHMFQMLPKSEVAQAK